MANLERIEQTVAMSLQGIEDVTSDSIEKMVVGVSESWNDSFQPLGN